MLCCMLSVVVGVIFGLQETSSETFKEDSSCGDIPYVSASIQEAVGYSSLWNEWCGHETSESFHTKSWWWVPGISLLLGYVIAVYHLIASHSKKFG